MSILGTQAVAKIMSGFTRENGERLWDLSFKSADTLFKFVSWFLIIAALRYAKQVSGEVWLSVIIIPLNVAFVVAALCLVLYLVVRDPQKLGIKAKFAFLVKLFDWALAICL